MDRRTMWHLQRALVCLLLLTWVAPVAAQPATPASTPIATETDIQPDFPSGMTFHATIRVDPEVTVDEASLYFRIISDKTLNQAFVDRTNLDSRDTSVSVSVFVNMQTAYIPPGATLEYFWELSAGGMTKVSTVPETIKWMDTRFNWQESRSEQVSLFTFGLSNDFVTWMLEQSQATVDDLEARYHLDTLPPIAIWVYPDTESFAGTRQVNMRESIAGVSYPGSSLIVAVVPDKSEREFGRVIPHEISHQALFHATENPYSQPPLWLDEGLATHYQVGGTDHYPGMVWRAARAGSLFDITSLNASFPYLPAQATLAYASSWSAVEYIETTYGPEGIERLIEAFKNGLPDDDAIVEALGISASAFNAEWHKWVVDSGDPDG